MAMYKDLRRYDADTADFVASKLLRLRANLAEAITDGRRPNSLIIGSWNIREFDSGKGGDRLPEAYHYLAEIIDRFDVCAIQEVRGDLGPLKRLVGLLGPNWEYFVTDVTAGAKGNYERIAIVYNRNRVFFRNLIGEIVLSDRQLINGAQFARTPFFAAFQAMWFRFILVTTHVYFGDDSGAKFQHRLEELRRLGEVIAKRGDKEGEVYVLVGDLNVVGRDDDTMAALTDAGLAAPDFGPTNLKGDKFYDHIAFSGGGERVRLLRHGVLDWRDVVFQPEEIDHYEPLGNRLNGEPRYKNWERFYPQWCTHQMSDHLPIWVELEIDYSDDYLRRFVRA